MSKTNKISVVGLRSATSQEIKDLTKKYRKEGAKRVTHKKVDAEGNDLPYNGVLVIEY